MIQQNNVGGADQVESQIFSNHGDAICTLTINKFDEEQQTTRTCVAFDIIHTKDTRDSPLSITLIDVLIAL